MRGLKGRTQRPGQAMIIDIKDFALSGQFGPFALGASKADVIETLGEPEDEASRDDGSEIIYAWYELFFDSNDRLCAIKIDHYDARHVSSYQYRNENFEIAPWLMTSPEAPTMQDVMAELDREAIEYRSETDGGRHHLVLSSGVTIDFHPGPKEPPQRPLLGFHYFPDTVGNQAIEAHG